MKLDLSAINIPTMSLEAYPEPGKPSKINISACRHSKQLGRGFRLCCRCCGGSILPTGLFLRKASCDVAR